jgi:hypothetical protein
MTTWKVAAPLALLPLLLGACSQQDDPATASGAAPAEQPAATRTTGADDPDADARDEGYASAAAEARAREYGGADPETTVATAEEDSGAPR